MEHTVKTDMHTRHGNQQPYKDKLETTVGSQATAVKLGRCAVLTSAGDSNQYSKHYDP